MEGIDLQDIIRKTVEEYRREEKESDMFTTWLKGLFAALIGGATVGATQALGAGKVTGAATGTSAAVGAALALGAYLTQSPVAASPAGQKEN